MTKVTKIAISVPKATFATLERVRRRTGKSRSAIVVLALEEWLRGLDASEADRRYIEGYRRHPENLAEIEAMTILSTAHLGAWDAGAPSRAAEPQARERTKRR